jgi:hypothetical protein
MAKFETFEQNSTRTARNGFLAGEQEIADVFPDITEHTDSGFRRGEKLTLAAADLV